MSNYYADKLNSNGLFKVYDTKIDRVTQYLDAEIDFVRKRLSGTERILELGAGYGRIMKALAGNCESITGIDISELSVNLGKEYLKDCVNCEILCMDAHDLTMERKFDAVLCLQNGLSSIKGAGGASNLVSRAMSVLKDNGTAYFSGYSPKFWEHRLEWFKEQADKGLIGEIDLDETKNGNIVCKDGFRARTITYDEFTQLGQSTGCKFDVIEHDESSLFLIINK